MRRIDHTGKKYGFLVARWPAGRIGKQIVWLCSCVCGNLSVVRSNAFSRLRTISCGCKSSRYTLKDRLLKHGMTRTPTYKTWLCMVARCTKKGHEHYKYYGGRGISVCDRWLKFENFFADMGRRPLGLTLDRINNNGNYEPNNCRWADRITQRLNSRKKGTC
jgi:hypothetical protein